MLCFSWPFKTVVYLGLGLQPMWADTCSWAWWCTTFNKMPRF